MMRALAASRSWAIPWGSAAALALLFALYCQLHSVLEAVDTPAAVSLRWGALAGGPAGLLLWAAVRWRAGLARLASGSNRRAAMLGVALFSLLAVGGGAIHRTVSGGASGSILNSSFDLVPVAGALSLLTMLYLRSHRTAAPEAAAVVEELGCWSEWLVLPEEPRLCLRRSDLSVVRSAGNYCELHARGRTHLVRVPLKEMAKRLQALEFVQVHRTTLVSLDRIASVEPGRSGDRVRLTCGAELPIGRTYRQALDRSLAGRSSHLGDVRPAKL